VNREVFGFERGWDDLFEQQSTGWRESGAVFAAMAADLVLGKRKEVGELSWE